MTERRRYPAPGIVVGWDAERCFHSRECVRALPLVFDPGRRPWIDAGAAAAADVAAAVRRCPSGALTYAPTGDDPSVTAEETGEVVITASPGGPLLVRGDVRVVDGDEVVTMPRAALCRCGGSTRKPFCDGTHRTNGFTG